MKNLKLYENYAFFKLPNFENLLNEFSQFFPNSIKNLNNPEKYDLGSVNFTRRRESTKTPEKHIELYEKLVSHANKKGYKFSGYPETKAYDYKKYRAVIKSLYLPVENEFSPALCLPTRFHNENYFFVITIGEKITNFALYKTQTLDLLDHLSENLKEGFGGLVFDNGDFVTADFVTEEIVTSSIPDEDDYISYLSESSSNGKKYSFSISIDRKYQVSWIESSEYELKIVQ